MLILTFLTFNLFDFEFEHPSNYSINLQSNFLHIVVLAQPPPLSLTTGLDIDHPDEDTTENLIRMVYDPTSTYYATQIHNELNWSAKIKDSAGYPMDGVRVEFKYETEDISTHTSVQYTNALGIASTSSTLPDCTGYNSVVHYHAFSPSQGYWKTEYDAGAWIIEVPQARGNSEFFGGYEEVGVSPVNMAHICKQTYLP
jgi:hypothetical protein